MANDKNLNNQSYNSNRNIVSKFTSIIKIFEYAVHSKIFKTFINLLIRTKRQIPTGCLLRT